MQSSFGWPGQVPSGISLSVPRPVQKPKMEGAVEMPALGRPFQLGRLYDCRRDSLIPDVTLWDADLLQARALTEDRPGTDFQLLPSESLASKASALGLKGSQKASFLGGLFEVGGAAAYLEENPPSGNHARAALHLSVTTERKFLPPDLPNQETVSYREAIVGSATHVVVALLYGAQAFLVFDGGVSDAGGSWEVQRHLVEMIAKISQVANEGRSSPRWSDAERDLEAKVRCMLYGDIIPLKHPTTFQMAVEMCANFRQVFGDRGKMVPVKAWLYPLIKLAPKAARLVRDPPLGWLGEAEAHLQALMEVDRRCQELIRSPVAVLFPEMKDHVEQLRALARQHGLVFRQEVGEALLGVRAGWEEARVLRGLFGRLLRSPFRGQALRKLLARKQWELDFVKLCLSRLEGLEVVSTPDKLEEILFDCRDKVVVAFVLTSLHREEPSLEGLRGWLGFKGHGETAMAGPSSEQAPSQLWFEDEERKQWIRCAVSSLSEFAEIHRGRESDVRFLVSSVWDESHPGASVYLYVHGKLVNRGLELPFRPAPPEVELRHPSSVWVRVNPVSFGAGSVSRYQLEYRIAGDRWTSLDTEGRLEDGVTLDVHLELEYQFRCAAVTQIGIGGWSEITCLSAPEKLGQEAPLPGRGRAEIWPRSPGREVPELRVILVGKTGAGKSATGNTILKGNHFVSEMSCQTVTQSCQKGEGWWKGRKILVVDTPGVCDTQRPEAETSAALKKSLQLCPPGPHAIVHVLKVGMFTAEEKATVRLLKSVFQAKALPRYFIILFTGKEDLDGASLESFLSAQDKELKRHIAECGSRCLAFSNRAEGAAREAQVEELIQMVLDLVGKNREAPHYAEETPKGWMGSLF